MVHKMRYPIFCQFMHNAFLGKVRLSQGKVIFCLKVILKKPAGGHIRKEGLFY